MQNRTPFGWDALFSSGGGSSLMAQPGPRRELLQEVSF